MSGRRAFVPLIKSGVPTLPARQHRYATAMAPVHLEATTLRFPNISRTYLPVLDALKGRWKGQDGQRQVQARLRCYVPIYTDSPATLGRRVVLCISKSMNISYSAHVLPYGKIVVQSPQPGNVADVLQITCTSLRGKHGLLTDIQVRILFMKTSYTDADPVEERMYIEISFLVLGRSWQYVRLFIARTSQAVACCGAVSDS